MVPMWSHKRPRGFVAHSSSTCPCETDRALENQLVAAGRRKASIYREMQRGLSMLEVGVDKVQWIKVFKASFMLLFVAYPG